MLFGKFAKKILTNGFKKLKYFWILKTYAWISKIESKKRSQKLLRFSLMLQSANSLKKVYKMTLKKWKKEKKKQNKMSKKKVNLEFNFLMKSIGLMCLFYRLIKELSLYVIIWHFNFSTIQSFAKFSNKNITKDWQCQLPQLWKETKILQFTALTSQLNVSNRSQCLHWKNKFGFSPMKHKNLA